MCNPRPLASAGGNLDLVPNAPVLHDAAPITNKVHFSGKGDGGNEQRKPERFGNRPIESDHWMIFIFSKSKVIA
jgi:hypothetical protein